MSKDKQENKTEKSKEEEKSAIQNDAPKNENKEGSKPDTKKAGAVKKTSDESKFKASNEEPNEEQLKAKKDLKDDRDEVQSGMIVSVYEKIIDKTPKGEDRERIQVYKGMVLARKHGKEPGASITVRKQSGDVMVEKIFPIYNPLIERIVIEKRFKVRRSKLFFLRKSKKRLKEIK